MPMAGVMGWMWATLVGSIRLSGTLRCSHRERKGARAQDMARLHGTSARRTVLVISRWCCCPLGSDTAAHSDIFLPGLLLTPSPHHPPPPA